MKKKNKLTALLMAVVMVASLVSGIAHCAPTKVTAAEAGAYIEAASSEGLSHTLKPGETVHLSVPVKIAAGQLTVTANKFKGVGEDSFLKIDNIKVLYDSGIEASMPQQFNNGGATRTLEFDLTVDKKATIGTHSIDLAFDGYYGAFDMMGNYENEPVTSTICTIRVYVDSELQPIQLGISKAEYTAKNVYAGNKFDVALQITNFGELDAKNVYVSFDSANGIVAAGGITSVKIGDIPAGKTVNKTVTFNALANAADGVTAVTAEFSWKDASGNADKSSSNFYITVKKVEKVEDPDKAPKLSLSTADNYKVFTRGTSDKLVIDVENKGDEKACEVTLVVLSGLDITTGVTKNYTGEGVSVGTVKVGDKKTAAIPVSVSEDAPAGMFEVSLEARYKSADGTVMTAVPMTLYVQVPKKEAEEEKKDEEIKPHITITDVTQAPSSPKAGDSLSVTFTINNDGNTDINNVRVCGEGLSSNGFEPVSSNPYKTVGNIDEGHKKNVTMNFKVGELVTSGVQPLTIGIEYTDSKGEDHKESVLFYILNVVAKDTSVKSISKPKLIISQYSTDEEVLKAGATFNFSFTIRNTHATKAAKNIKVTLSQAEGVFSPSQGSNIFYVAEIPAGTEEPLTMSLKTRADVATGDYPISILLEYEYDDMSEADQEKGGVSEENVIKLRATENYRPVISNLYIDSYSTLRVGESCDLSFEFYNMGKSNLGNVYLTVEGDFELANNSSMSYIGSVSGYGQEYVNPQIVPLVGGDATGILTIHFEDSNGDEVTLSEEFSAYVEETGGSDDPFFGGDDFQEGYYDDNGIYHNADGSYIDADGLFHDAEGGWYDQEGNYHTADEANGSFLTKLPLWVKIAVPSVIVLIILIVVIAIAAKKRKAREAAELEEY